MKPLNSTLIMFFCFNSFYYQNDSNTTQSGRKMKVLLLFLCKIEINHYICAHIPILEN